MIHHRSKQVARLFSFEPSSCCDLQINLKVEIANFEMHPWSLSKTNLNTKKTCMKKGETLSEEEHLVTNFKCQL